MSEASDVGAGLALVRGAGEEASTPAAPASERHELLAPLQAPAVVQSAALAIGGFAAGAVFAGLFRRRRHAALALGGGRRRAVRRTGRGRGGRAAELVQVVASRSLLVDVHLLGGPGER